MNFSETSDNEDNYSNESFNDEESNCRMSDSEDCYSNGSSFDRENYRIMLNDWQNLAYSERSEIYSVAKMGRLEEVKQYIMAKQHSINVLSMTLLYSCERGHLDIVKWLMENTEADVNFIDRKMRWNTPLTAACYNDHLDIVQYLEETGRVSLSLPNDGGDTALTKACLNSSKSVLMYLLCEVNDLDVNIGDRFDNRALHLVVWCSKDNDSQLHMACRKGDENEVMRMVFINSQNINDLNNVGNTPLHIACKRGHSIVVQNLMLLGADETITNDRTQTPAHVAKKFGHSKLLNLLNRNSLWKLVQKRQKKWKISLTLRQIRKRRIGKNGKRIGRTRSINPKRRHKLESARNAQQCYLIIIDFETDQEEKN